MQLLSQRKNHRRLPQFANSKTRRHQFELLESRELLAVITWDGGRSGTGTDWFDAQNWEGNRLPGSRDQAVIPRGFTDVTIARNALHEQVTIERGAGVSLVDSRLQSSLIIEGSLTVYGNSTADGRIATGRESLIEIVGTADRNVVPAGIDAVLNATFGFDNFGSIHLRSDSTSRGGGDNATLVVQNGELTNFGEINFVPPGFAGQAFYDINAPLVNERNAEINVQLDRNLRGHDIQASFSRGRQEYENNGSIQVVGGDLVTGSTSSWVNTGTISVSRGQNFDPGNAIVQRAGTIDVEGELGSINQFDLNGGTLTGTGRVDANVSHSGGQINPGPTHGILTISGNLSQTGNATTVIDVAGTTAGTNHDRVVVNKTATLDGTLTINRDENARISPNDTISVINADTVRNRFARNNASATDFDLRQNSTEVTLTAVGRGDIGVEESRQEIVAGINQIKEILPRFDSLFSLDANNIPLLPTDLSAFDGWPSVLSQTAASWNPPTSVANSYAELGAELGSLGFELLCIEGGTVCTNGSILEFRHTSTQNGISGNIDLGGAMENLLKENGLPTPAELKGTINFSGSLDTDFVLGIDANGFYLRGDSGTTLTLSGYGEINTAYDLPIPGIRVSSEVGSQAEGAFNIALTGGKAENRHRLADLQTPQDILSTTVNGDVDGFLELSLGTGAATDLPITASWSIPVRENSIDEFPFDVTLPSADEFLNVLVPIFLDGVQTVVDPVVELLDTVPLPFTDEKPQSATSDRMTRGIADDAADWFAEMGDWLSHKFEYIASLFSDPAPAGQGQFYTQGDVQTRAHQLRMETGATGAGIKIGVISDNASSEGLVLARRSGDLPVDDCTTTTVGPCVGILDAGVYEEDGDEGIAMMEIIHDIAPEAQIYFATGWPGGVVSPAGFAGAVTQLVDAGVDIIVDDLFFTEEPYFDESASIVASRINQVLEAGDNDILFVTAAGNETLRHLQDTFRPVSSPSAPLLSTGNLHNWNHRGGTDISIPLPTETAPFDDHYLVLQWSDTFHDPTQQYRIELVDPLGQVYNNAHPNIGNFRIRPTHFIDPSHPGVFSYAYDSIYYELNTPTPIEVAIVEVSADPTKPQPAFEIFTNSYSELPPNTPVFQSLCTTYANHPACPLENDAVYGHAAITNMLAVGAVGSNDLRVQSYSQHGGSTVRRTDTPGFIVRDSLDVLGIDGVEHSSPTGFSNPFYGTSAAAPHVAAITALLKQLHPTASSGNIRTAIEQSADDYAERGYDVGTGYGLIDAVAASQHLEQNHAVIDIRNPVPAMPSFHLRGRELFEALDMNIENLLTGDQLWDLIQGEWDPNTEIVRLSIDLHPTDVAPISGGYGFDWESDVFGAIGDLGLGGKIDAELRPDVHFQFGFDGNGFFIGNDTSFGGQINANGELSGRFGDFEAVGQGEFELAPQLAFTEAPEKMRLGGIVGHIANDSTLAFGNVTADLAVDLKVGLLDYVDVDGDSSNNTEHGGDPFTFRGTTTVTANLDSIDISNLSDFEYDFSNVGIANPDVNGDETDDYTLSALGDNLIELTKDVLRGERTIFGADLSGAFETVISPLTEGPLVEWLGIQSAIDSFLAEAEEDTPDENEAISDIIDFSLSDELFDDLRGVLDTGLATEPFDIARITVNLGEIPLDIVDEKLNFDLQTILPDSLDLTGRAGIEDAHLSGQLVFGIDTSLNPLYLLTEPDEQTPELATTLGGGFDLYVNVSGEPLGNGILSLTNADARVSPELIIDFEDLGIGRMRIGSDLLALGNVNVSLENEEVINLSADAISLTPGPFLATASDDNDTDEIPAVTGSINVYTGEMNIAARKFVAGLADILEVEALPTPRVDNEGAPVMDPETNQPIIDPGVTVTFNPSADDVQTLISTPTLQAQMHALTVGDPPNELTPFIEFEGLTVDHAGQVSLPAAELVIPEGYLNAAGLAGFLPVEVNRVRVEFPDPTDLNAMTVCTTGQFLADDLGTQIESIFGTPVTPILQIGNEETSCDGNPPSDGQFDFLLNVESLQDGVIEPVNLGPITFGVSDLEVAGSVIDGQITLGGYQDGAWNSSLAGSFSFQTDADDPSDDDLIDLSIEIDPARSSLAFDDTSASLQVVAEAELTTAINGPFGNFAAGGSLGFTLGIVAARSNTFPFFDITNFDVSLGELSIDSIEILFEDVIKLTASDITLNPNVNDPQTDPYGTVGNMTVEILAFQDAGGTPLPGLQLQQASVDIEDVTLFQDEMRLSDVTFHLDGSFSTGGTTLIDVDDALLSFKNFVIPNPLSQTPITFPSLSDLFAGDGINSPQIAFSLDHAVLLPDGSATTSSELCTAGETVGGLASVCGLSGTFDGDGTLEIVADRMAANLADVVQLDADDSVLRIGPNVASTDPLLEIGTAGVSFPLLRENVRLTASDLQIDRTGAISITGAELDATADDPDEDGGVLTALGLGDFLPFDVTRIRLTERDNNPIRLDDLTSGNYQIGVDGYFDFSIFDSFPVKPVVRMEGTGQQTEADRDGNINPFHIVFNLDESGVSIQETGLITLGFSDLTFGPLSADAEITIGRFFEGQFEAKHFDNEINDLADGVLATLNVEWDQGDGELFDFATGARVVGNLTQTLDVTDPDKWTTTLDLDGVFQGSLLLASDEGDDAWRFDLQDLEVDFGVELSVNEQFQFVENPSEEPVLTFEGLSASHVEVGLGEYMTLAADNVAIDFTALQEDVDAPFITFGGERPNRPQATPNDQFPALDVDNLDGQLSVTFGGPLNGLGGAAGNFGIGYNAPDPDATEFEFPLEFYQLPGFFVALQVPDDFKFGMPDWLPLKVSEIGLRFPDTFGDLLPFGDGETTEEEGDLGTIAKAGLDILSNFSLLFSGGLESRDGGWPLQGLVEDVEVNVDSLAACAEHVVSQTDVNGINYSAGLNGLTQAIREQGLGILTSISECKFPIENLDAVDIGVEPFKIGPVEIGGGLGFGTVDVVDENEDPQEVLFGRIEGQFAYSDMGLGVELIVTEYGPVLARLFAGVPIPIGTLVGSLAGSVVPGLGTAAGAALGTQSGFMLTGFQGGLVFDGQPLPPVSHPNDLLNDPGIRFPLDVGMDEIRDAAQTAVQNGTMTWNNGFTLSASGTLTNIHVHGMIGATLTLGANIGFDAQEILGLADNQPIPADAFEFTDDEGNSHQPCGQTDLGIVPDLPVGFQLFGFGALEILGQSLVDVGLMFDYSDPINPAVYMAGAIPQPGSILSLLIPGEATAGLQLCSDGIVEGSILAMQTFVDQIIDDTSGYFFSALDDIAERLQENRDLLLSQLVLNTTADTIIDAVEARQPINGAFLRQRIPQLLSSDFGTAALVATELLNEFTSVSPPSVLTAKHVLRQIAAGNQDYRSAIEQVADELNADKSHPLSRLVLNTNPTRKNVEVAGVVVQQLQSIDAEEAAVTITTSFLSDRVNRLLRDSTPGTQLYVADELIRRINTVSPNLLPDNSIVLPGDRDDPLNVLLNSLVANIQAAFETSGAQAILDQANQQPDPFDEPIAFELKQNAALATVNVTQQIAFASQVADIFINAGSAASDAFFHAIDPSLTFSAAIQPKLFGIEIGEPTDRIDLRIDKEQIHFDFRGSILSRIAPFLPITDTFDIFVDIPFENLFQDLFYSRVPQVDFERDFRGGIVGTLGLAGIDLADFAGIIFPAVDGNTIPDDHLLNTRVRIVGDGAVVGDDILVQPDDFETMKDYGGLLLDGRLTLPSLIIDPFAELGRLQGVQANLFSQLQTAGCSTLWDCLISNPGAFFDAATNTLEILGEEQQVAQLQLYMPGDTNVIANEFYVKGQYGTSPDGNTVTSGKLLGVDLGGAFVSYQNGRFVFEQDSPDIDADPLNPDPEIRVELDAGLSGIPRASLEVSIDTSDPQASPLDALVTQLDFLPSGAANPGAWLDSGLFDINAEVELQAYTPGFELNPSGEFARLKQHGGVRLDAAGSMSGYFGSIDGDLEFEWTPADGFSGEFRGSATLSFPNLVGQIGNLVGINSPSELFNIELASVAGEITESGCVSIYVSTVDSDAQFALTPGGCNPAVSVLDSSVEEGGAAEVTFVIQQLPDNVTGSARIYYQIADGEGTIGATSDDYTIPGQQIDIDLSNYSTNQFGINFVEGSIFVPTTNDALLEPNEFFTVEIDGLVMPGSDAILLNPSASVFIFDNDEPSHPNYDAPGIPTYTPGSVPTFPRVFFDFQDDDGEFDRMADQRFDSLTTTSMTYLQGGVVTATGLADDHPNGATVGRAAAPPTGIFVFGARPVYEFKIEPEDNGIVPMVPRALEFWDFPSDDPTWAVEVEVDGYPIETFDVAELFTITADFSPNIHPDLVGWRRLRALIDLEGPQQVFTPTSPVGYAGEVTVRIVPTGLNEGGRKIDNVALFGSSNFVVDLHDGLEYEIDDLMYGRVEFEINRGPGNFEVVVAQGDVDPIPYIESVTVTGTDETTVLSVNAQFPQGRERDAVFSMGNFVVDGPLAMFDTTSIQTIAGNFQFNGLVQDVHVNQVADGSAFSMAGNSRDVMHFESDGTIGGGRDGVDLSFGGVLNADVESWLGGDWEIGQGRRITSRAGDLSPSMNIGAGFDLIEVSGGDLLSPSITTGTLRGTDGSSGQIRVLSDRNGRGGSILTRNIDVDGDIAAVQAIGGSIRTNLSAERIGSIITETTTSSDLPANLGGTISGESIDVVSTTGGDITADIITRDRRHSNLEITATADRAGRGGNINSQFSFHIAGGVEQILAKEINLSLDVGGEVRSIVATGGEDSDARLVGRLSAERFGEIVVTSGEADFFAEATTTETDRPAIESIRVPSVEDVIDRVTVSDSATEKVGELIDVDEIPREVGDFDGDQRLTPRDIDLLCRGVRSNDRTYDLTGDGAIDENDLDFMIEDLFGSIAGDANLDGAFDSEDLIQIFIAAEYEDNIRGNSSWRTGDWNCNGEFDTEDLVVAFRKGGYTSGATTHRKLLPNRATDAALAAVLDAEDRFGRLR